MILSRVGKSQGNCSAGVRLIASIGAADPLKADRFPAASQAETACDERTSDRDSRSALAFLATQGQTVHPGPAARGRTVRVQITPLAVHARLRLIPNLSDLNLSGLNLSGLAWHIRGITALAIAFVVVGALIRLGGLG